MVRLNILHFETIFWIARLGTFTAAAKRLNTTQPTISSRVRELENALQFNVFDRIGRNATLTPQGRMLIEQVEPLIRNMEQVTASLTDTSAASGRVRIGVGQVSSAWFPQMILDLQVKMPQVFFDVEVNNASELSRKVWQGHLDIAIVAGTTGSSRLITEELGRTPLNWYVSPDLLTRYDVTDTDIGTLFQRAILWTVPRNSQFFPLAMTALERYGIDAGRTNSSHDMNFTIELVRKGAGIGFLPEILILEDIHSGSLLKVDVDFPDMLVSILFQTHPDRNSPLVQAIANSAKTISQTTLLPVKQGAEKNDFTPN